MKYLLSGAILIFGLCMVLASFGQGHQAMAVTQGEKLLAYDTMDLIVDDIVIRKYADQVNFRVRVRNVGAATAKNLKDNLTVYLRVKDEKTGQWRELQHWSNIDSIKADEVASRDYLPVRERDPFVLSPEFTLQAEIVVQNPDGIRLLRKIIERSYPQDAIIYPN